MSRTNVTRHMEWHETCKCECWLNASVFNNKQRWNKDKCRFKCKESIDKDVSDKGFIWNPSNCECECDKSCDVREYSDYESCKYRKKLIDKLVEEYTKNVEEVKLVKITLAEEGKNKPKYSSCTLYIVLFSIIFLISIEISGYFHWYLKKDVTRVIFGASTQTTI